MMAKRWSWERVEQLGSSLSLMPSPLLSMPSVQEPHCGLSMVTSKRQPMLGTQESVVHGSWSSHATGCPPVQVLPTHCSPVVQKLPSSQAVPLGLVGCVQV